MRCNLFSRKEINPSQAVKRSYIFLKKSQSFISGKQNKRLYRYKGAGGGKKRQLVTFLPPPPKCLEFTFFNKCQISTPQVSAPQKALWDDLLTEETNLISSRDNATMIEPQQSLPAGSWGRLLIKFGFWRRDLQAENCWDKPACRI